jgi:multicomponent K+:H+ antiporter subunit D
LSAWTEHLMITPILLPLLVSASMLLFNERRRGLKRGLSIATTIILIANAAALLHLVSRSDAAGATHPMVYLLGNWPAPFGIVLVADRLSALLLLLTSILGFTSLFYALARWDRSGPRFHALFLLLLMGINGAFLTGDIFNLFVFFEVLLAASYGLILHGSGAARTKAGLHYITINVATSLLFLIGVSLIYAVTGTLNMADLATLIPRVPASDLMLLEGGAAILGTAFLVKAAMWPLGLWLPATYSAAAPPVAAIFAIMSKVGIYAILRLSLLLFGAEAGGLAAFAQDWLLYGGLVTIAFGTIGVLAARTLKRVAGYSLLISSGTLLAAIGVGSTAVLAGALFYLVSSTLAVSALYLIIEPVERRVEDGGPQELTEPIFDDEYTGALDEEEEDEVGVVIPATLAILGGGFIFCALLLAGLPPLSGFIAKFAILNGLLGVEGDIAASIWILIALMIVSGLATLVAMTRAGIDLLWDPGEHGQANLSILEAMPIAILLAICLALMIQAGAVMRYMEATARVVESRYLYIDAVRLAPRSGGETDP